MYLPRTFLLLGGLCLASAASAIDTSVIREMAKNITSVHIVYSGEHAKRYADRLVRDIVERPDYNNDKKKKKVESINAEQAAAAIKGVHDFTDETTIVIKSDDEQMECSSDVASAFRVPDTSRSYQTTIRVHALSNRAGKQGFSIILQAPDDERLGRIYDDLTKSRGSDYKHLDFEHTYNSSKVVVHSNENSVTSWGDVSGAWNYVSNAKVDESSPDPKATSEYDHAYVIDRSLPAPGLPDFVRDAVMKSEIKSGTAFATRFRLENGRDVVVLTAPNAPLLKTVLNAYRNVGAVPTNGYRRDIPDLRFLSKTKSLVKVNLELTGEEDKRIKNALMEYMGANMREMKIPVLDSTASGTLTDAITEDKMMGATNLRRTLKRAGTRYVWILSVTNISRRTHFDDASTRSPSEHAFNENPPARPVQYKGEKSDDFNQRYRQWQTDMEGYERRKQYWESEESVHYHQQVDRVQESNFEVQYKLFDLEQEAGQVTWETRVTGVSAARTTFQQRDQTVNGNLRHPDALTTPEAISNCEVSVVLTACRDAAQRAISMLSENAWLSGEPVTILFKPETTPTPGPMNTEPVSGKVTAISTTSITTEWGQFDGPDLGDIVTVTFANGKKVSFKVIQGGSTAKCTPSDAAAKTAMASIKKGMTVTYVPKVSN